MKKRILSCLLAALLVISAVPLTFAADYTLGDVDEDGTISSADARLALRASVKLEDLSDLAKKAADVDFDDSISSADARLILRASVGLEELKDPHTHAYTKATVTKQASCTEDGEKKLTCECGEFVTEKIPATGHKEILDTATVKAATCTEAGYTGDKKCSVCGTKLSSGTAVPAAGHKEVLDETTVKAATCVEEGYTGDTVCDICGILLKKGEVIPSEGIDHIMQEVTVAATCTQEGYKVTKCKNCDYYIEDSYVVTQEATDHTWGAPVVTDPTCTEQGYSLSTCTVCKADKKENYTPAKGHKVTWTTTKEATCEKEGEKEGKCSECDYETTEVIALTPHTLATNEVIGSKADGTMCKEVTSCTVCGLIVAENETHAAHTVRPAGVDEATCTSPQINHMACEHCSYSYDVVTSAGLGHSINPKSFKKATCTEDGEIVYSGHCNKCGETFADTIVTLPATGHELSGVQTCTTDVICTTCGEIVAERLGHNYTVRATAYNTDVEGFFCTRCQSVATDKIGAFNNVVNKIKAPFFYGSYSDSYYVSYIDKTSIKTSYSRFDFGIYTSAIRSLYEDEMANTPDEYSVIRQSHILSTIPLSLRNSNGEYVVSLLENSDIDSINIEKLTGMKASEVLANINPSYTNADQAAKFNTYKSKVVNDEVIKVTVDVKNEKYSQVKNLADTEKTALEKIYDLDIRDDAKEFKNENGELVMTETESGSGYEISMTMKLLEIYSDATVTYYFLADTYEPIMAVYDADITMDQTIDMSFRIALFSLNGELDPVISTHYTRTYFFPNFFA